MVERIAGDAAARQAPHQDPEGWRVHIGDGVGGIAAVEDPENRGSGVLGVGVLCAAEGLRLLGAVGCVGGDLLEQCVKCGLLLGVKGRKNPLFCGSECVLYLGQSARSCRREAHRVAAAVVRGASALDEVRGFEVVEQADQVGAVDSQRPGEVGLALLSHEVQKR
jgi:hypothetical protein